MMGRGKLIAGLSVVLAFCCRASASAPVAVTPCEGYNAWPMIQAVGGKLVCAYSRGSGHTIGEGVRGVYAKTSSDGGKTWSAETCIVNDPELGEVTIGKGLDGNGAMLLWVRNWGKARRHDLYRTSDGVTFEKIASPALDPMPIQITDVIAVPDVGLMSLWFAGDYKKGDGNSWGTLTSADNGRTWVQRTIESGLAKMEWPTEQSAAYLDDGRILAVARTERGGRSQFQLTSSDFGIEVDTTPVIIDGIPYEGPYEVTPKVYEQVLPTDRKFMTDDVTVHMVPKYEVANQYGTTCYIATDA